MLRNMSDKLCERIHFFPQHVATNLTYFAVVGKMFAAKFCRACGVDVAKDKKQRRTISRNAIFCSTLIPMASAVSDRLDVSKFEEGYVCKVCSRELEKMQKLQAQLDEVKGSIFSKLTNAAHLMPTTEMPAEREETQTPVRTSQKKRASDPQGASNERRKRRRLLQGLESAAPTTSTKGSPDVAVSHSMHLLFQF